ncbi:hypothetical protein [Myceligenerans crystallogenes]|uniref:hypothetical protein n=1 Tax=Myceligenerans crystallogenes TaxID=316335 RepID=UPI0031E4827C
MDARLTKAAVVVAAVYAVMMAVRPLASALGTTSGPITFGATGAAGFRFGFFASSVYEAVVMIVGCVLWIRIILSIAAEQRAWAAEA